VGLGLAIIMLKFLVPRVFSGFENALLAFFEVLQNILVLGNSAANSAGAVMPLKP